MNKKILVVDDDTIILESCKRILEAEHYTVLLASNVNEAIVLLEKYYFDLMIMDVKMPEKDGIFLLKKIRDKWPLDSWPMLPVLVMSGYPTPETLDTLYKNGARQFIAKPFTPDELINAANKVLKGGKNGKNKSPRN